MMEEVLDFATITPIRIPYCRDLSNLQIEESLKNHHWEFFVPEKSDFSWCVLLSSVIQLAHENSIENFKKVTERIKMETNDGTIAIKKLIRLYNPFSNRYRCFFNEELRSFHQALDERISQFEFGTVDVDSKSGTSRNTIRAICNLLKCRVTVISENERIQGSFLAPLNNPEVTTICPDDTDSEYDVVLYALGQGKEYRSFSFGLPSEIGNSLQINAVDEILLEAGITEKAEKLLDLDGRKENFVFAVMQKDELIDTVLQPILDQSQYISKKLFEAGIAVFPTEKCGHAISWDGYSKEFHPTPFFHALKKLNFRLLYSFYSCAVNAFPSLDGSVRDPNLSVKNNLEKVSAILIETNEFCKQSSSITSEHRIHLEELIKFNEYQQKICDALLRAKAGNASDRSSPKIVVEADDRKRVLSQILEIYLEYFFKQASNPRKHLDNIFECYTDYADYRYFYRNLDCMAALLFFDRSFALKKRLDLGKIHERIDSLFIHFMFFRLLCWELCSGNESQRRRNLSGGQQQMLLYPSVSSRTENEDYDNPLVLLSHLKRVEFYEHLVEFKTQITDVVVTEVNSRNYVNCEDVYTLQTDPEIKDEFLLLRLKRYLTLAVNINVDGDLAEASLIIQRVLQVVGESVKLDPLEEVTVTNSLLASLLKLFDDRDIRRIRDSLIHFVPEAIGFKIETEDHKELIEGAKKDLKEINDAMKHIFDLQRERISEYIFKNAVNSIVQCQNLLECPDSEKSQSCATAVNYDQTPKSPSSKEQTTALGKKCLLENCLKKFSYLKLMKSNDVRDKILADLPWFQQHLENLYLRIEYLAEIKAKKETDDEKEGEIKTLFSAISVLLKFFIKKVHFKSSLKTTYLKELQGLALSNQLTSGDFGDKEKLAEWLKSYKSLQQKVFKDLDSGTDIAEIDPLCEVDVQSLESLKKSLCGHGFISRERRETILSKVPEKFKNHHRARLRLIECFKNSKELSKDETEKLFGDLVFQSKKKKKSVLKAIDDKNPKTLENLIDYYEKLSESLEKNDLADKDYDFIDENFGFPKEIVSELKKITNKNRSEQPRVKLLSFFLDRVKLMKKVLVDIEPEFQSQWATIRNEETKLYMREKLASTYQANPNLQACIEVLLYDCMYSMKGKKAELLNFWEKAHYLFNQLDLRKFLSHGNPLFEAVTELLDTSDLPNDIISKALDLVSDTNTLESLQAVSEKIGDGGSEKLKNYVENAKNHGEMYSLCEKIKKCPKWKDYANLSGRGIVKK